MILKIKKFIVQQKILFITIFSVILFDKWTKILIQSTYQLGESRNVIGNFFKITYIENQGIAFGLFSDWHHPLKAIILLILSLVALLFIFNIYFKSKQIPILQISFGLILGGAFGNVYDRIIYKRVVDFLNFGIGSYRWPFFNIADSSITIGVTILIIMTIFFEEKMK